ncbi:hypothetical protein DLAC_07216 [Tieghemostelium lacteum]|uniref:Uncharacterized protein n=1 Tax=Tieghemostelium lacteum TaxID=361077 RepID=A0A151ZD62_TIELA|nr:hypothetical protein DLAC_07216 [Tieghemostelium lacteum]|eukprot:KYQ91880.1 hypothetical protein DLAC_07216 [Tieghemostelium lacteum]
MNNKKRKLQPINNKIINNKKNKKIIDINEESDVEVSEFEEEDDDEYELEEGDEDEENEEEVDDTCVTINPVTYGCINGVVLNDIVKNNKEASEQTGQLCSNCHLRKPKGQCDVSKRFRIVHRCTKQQKCLSISNCHNISKHPESKTNIEKPALSKKANLDAKKELNNQKKLELKKSQLEEAQNIIKYINADDGSTKELNALSMTESIKGSAKKNKNYFKINNQTLMLPKIDDPPIVIEALQPTPEVPVKSNDGIIVCDCSSIKSVSIFTQLDKSNYQSRSKEFLTTAIASVEKLLTNLNEELVSKETLVYLTSTQLNTEQLQYLLFCSNSKK